MEETTEKPIANRSIQDYLSIGYLFLLTLGIVRDVVFYGFLNVNVLNYSNVLDVLLSPLAFLAKNPKPTIALLVACVIIYYLLKWNHDKKKEKSEEEPKVEANSIDGMLFLIALFFISFFLGTGIGSGWKYSDRIKKGDIKMSHQLKFNDGETVPVKLIGNNSQYVFYLLENVKEVSISPIAGNIKAIDRLPEKKENVKKSK